MGWSLLGICGIEGQAPCIDCCNCGIGSCDCCTPEECALYCCLGMKYCGDICSARAELNNSSNGRSHVGVETSKPPIAKRREAQPGEAGTNGEDLDGGDGGIELS
jgi:hypothetical protein